MMPMKFSSTQGVIYCATDSWYYLESAVISAFALRQVSPNLPIIILSNIKKTGLQEQLSEFNIVIKLIDIPDNERLNNAMVSRIIKTSLHTFTEFDETLYLDADILPLKPIDEIWSFLEFEDVAIALDIYPIISQSYYNDLEEAYTLKICPADSAHFNGGVLLWKNTSDAHTLFNTWQKEWRIFKNYDQLALCRAIQETKTKIAHLPYTYNYPIPWLFSENITLYKDVINKFKPDFIQLNDIKLFHCFRTLKSSSRKFKEIARKLMPDTTEKALECLKYISD